MELISFSSPDDLARAVADAWLTEVAAANRMGQPYHVALSGGRITLKFFASAIALARDRRISLLRVHFFWADERCVPPNDPESTFAAADKHFFQPLGIAEDKIHRIHGEDLPEDAARHAEGELCRLAPLNEAGQPVLDLILLGMGEDGHVASLFPGEGAEMMQDKAVCRVVRNSPKPPSVRVTLGYQTIAAAREVWVLASGSGKEVALHASLKADGQTPLARVLKLHSTAKVFTDIKVG